MAAVGIGTVISGLSDGINIVERARLFFSPAPIVAEEPQPDEAVTAAPSPEPAAPIATPDEISAPRLAEDITTVLARRLLSTCISTVEVENVATRNQSADETSHGFPSTFLQASLVLTLNSVDQRFSVAGSGRGPAAKDDAYRTLLENAVAEVRKTAPGCFR
ncbi:MAG: hypothetical protein AAGA87_11775 [Pseudomonadota bacterium]